jgi:amidohydrolase
MKNFLDEAEDLFEFTREQRRDFHKHPEIGLKEFRTAETVAKQLKNLGMEVQTGIGQTGVVGILEGKAPGPVVLVRFDMDALPIQEETEAKYASVIPGLMHACGHDGHIAIGLTVARILTKNRKEFSGTVKFIFQPGEEGLGGAEKMIADGILEDPKPDKALGLHVWNEKPTGWVGIVPGPVMAAADTFSVRIIGKGGHGAVPNLTSDPIIAAAQFINALQSIVSRNISPLKTAVVSVGAIHGGDAFNVIPASVELKGTLRTFEPEVRDTVVRRFNEIAVSVVLGMGCQAEMDIQSITPAVVNDPIITKQVQQVAEELLPQDELDFQSTTMGAEDMAFILNKVPGCYFFVGSANKEQKLDAPHHSSHFDFDETILPKATGLMVASVMELLGK